mmetsp:Transcript_37680/g.82553  ORF Transcript_37680/g.82553 Transcript_37680/m.82553 type:complete len:107 (+) Transcript_37680:96-416(+)
MFVSTLIVLALLLVGDSAASSEDEDALLVRRQDRLRRNARVRKRRVGLGRNLQPMASFTYALRDDVGAASTLLRGAGSNMTGLPEQDDEMMSYAVVGEPEPEYAVP